MIRSSTVKASADASERRRRLVRRGAPALAGLALVALSAGLATGAAVSSGEEAVARRYLAAWERGDHAAMHALLTPAARARTPERAFRIAHRRAAATATLKRFETGRVRMSDGAATAGVRVETRAFSTYPATIRLPIESDLVAWEPHLALPGLGRGEVLGRFTRMPPRAPLLARDGAVLAEGPAIARRRPLGPVAGSIAGELGAPPTPEERREAWARGVPRGAPVGVSGLERLLEERLAGRPGGVLRGGTRVLASAPPRAADPVRSSIDLAVQAAALDALAGRFGGVAALDALSGEVRALAGIAISGAQPPGSTFKIVTALAALESGAAAPRTRYPVETRAVLEGVELENANGEACGGSFVDAFAHSCNSVFAPLGVKVGAERLVATAERFGFNRPPLLDGAAASTIPPAGEIGGPLALGSTAIGQGRLLATPLVIAGMAQAVAADGVLREPSLVNGEPGRARRVMSPEHAARLEQMMRAVVARGTGERASLLPVRVAGKTGTAELGDTTDGLEGDVSGTDTDAWFTAYAPVRRPELAVAVLLVRNGAGGETAAPAAREVLEAGLG